MFTLQTVSPGIQRKACSGFISHTLSLTVFRRKFPKRKQVSDMQYLSRVHLQLTLFMVGDINDMLSLS